MPRNAKSRHPRSPGEALWQASAPFRRPNLTVEFRRPTPPSGSAPPDASAIRASWDPVLEHHRVHIDHQVKALRARLAGLPSLQVLATLAVTTMMRHPESYRESESRYSGLHAEYATWLYLTAEPKPDLLAPVLWGGDFQDILNLLDDVIESTRSYYSIKAHLARQSPDTAKEEIGLRARLWHLFVRSPAYDHHNAQQLLDLFGPFARETAELVGFNVEQAIQIEAAMSGLVDNRLNAQLKEMADLINHWHAMLRKRPTRSARPTVDSRVVARLRKQPNPHEAAVAAAFSWAQSTWHQAFIVRPSDIAARIGLTDEVVRALLVRFGMGFGQADRPDHWPSVEGELERRPLVDLGDGTWFVNLIPKLQWAIAPGLEDALQHSVHWEHYQTHRSRYLERRAVNLIAGSNPRVGRWTRLKYGDRTSGQPDLDGLVLVGGTAILIEAKAGRMDTASRRGAPTGMKKDLRGLLSEPQQQLNRATDHILGKAVAVFETADGTVTVRRDELRRIVHVIVTGDSLTAFVTRLPQLALAGVFNDRSLPWSVDIIDLEVITDILGQPDRLVHYVDRRMRAARRGVEAPEELDFLGHYLTRGLYFDELDPEVDTVLLTSHTEALDDYYLHLSGQRATPAPKPALRTHPVLDDLIRALEEQAPAGYAEATFWILELSPDAQSSLAQMIEGRRERARAGHLSVARMMFGKLVLAYLAYPGDEVRRADGYVEAVKYLGKVDQAVGIIQSATDPHRVAVSIQYSIWRHNPDLERRATKTMAMFDSQPAAT